MFFWISLVFLFSPLAGLIVGCVIGWVVYQDEKSRGMADCMDFFFPAAMTALFSCIGLIASIPAITAWSHHADDVAKVEAQHHRIAVYEERIESLTTRLSEFDYPEKPTVSLDADTPWASMVNSLNDAESELARAKDERAIAIRSIRARMRGPMSGVVTFVGLPESMQ